MLAASGRGEWCPYTATDYRVRLVLRRNDQVLYDTPYYLSFLRYQ